MEEKDKRYILRVSDEKLASQIQLTLIREKLSQQEFIDKYVKPNLPSQDWDVPHETLEKCLEEFTAIIFLPDQKKDIQDIFGTFWAILMRIYRNEFQASSVKRLLDVMLHGKMGGG